METKSLWFSSNPDKAWVEKFFLIYSPIWMLVMAIVMIMGWQKSFSDMGLLLLSVFVAAPAFLVPLIIAQKYTDKPWYESYWFKANLYLAIFGFFGNYFGSEYFFDVLGMVYNFPNATTRLDSALLGTGVQTVPVIMYTLTHVYFMTYHATGNIALRRLSNAVGNKTLLFFLFPVFIFVIGYCWAWAETKAMANPLMAGLFYYQKMDVMLAYGSAIYATYFLASFPIYYFMDEDREKPWNTWQVMAAAMSASMITFYLLDFAAHKVGHL